MLYYSDMLHYDQILHHFEINFSIKSCLYIKELILLFSVMIKKMATHKLTSCYFVIDL